MSYRPHFHFSPPSGWMNDPNGLVFHDGWWHLFYQHHPASLGWGPMHWGHARSRDLVHWEHLPIALFPDDEGAIWSGSAAVTDDGRLIACYTRQAEREQVQCLAFSEDGGTTWTKYGGNPVLSSERADFRDPKIWKMDDRWMMIIAAGPGAQIFSSPDTFVWTLESEFFAPVEGWIWECPDLFLLDEQWVLIGSFVVPGQPHETHFWLGDFDGKTFVPSLGPERLSFGPDDYAAVSWSDAPDGRRIIIGWMNAWTYGDKTPTQDEGFRGAMTLPRELSIRDGKLVQRPVREVETLRCQEGRLQLNEGKMSVPLLAPSGNAFEIEVLLDVSSAQEAGFRVHGDEDEQLWVGFKDGQLELDRTQGGRQEIHPLFAARFAVPCELRDGRLELHIFVDASSVEVFAQGGLLYGAALHFLSGEAKRIEFEGQEGKARIVHGALWPLTRAKKLNSE